MFALLGVVLAVLAVAGMPLFAVLGGISILSWFGSSDARHHFLRHVAANVLDDKFADSTILVTIPLFVFVGYLMAESNTPQRIVRAAGAALGWLPGGLAIVCIFATAIFTMLTGGSGVAIVAIGGLLFPVLLQQGYSRAYSLGLVTTAGAVGLLLPPSPLVLIYCYVTGIDVGRTYKATVVPGLVLVVILALHAVVVGIRTKVPRQKFELGTFGREMWAIKWEAMAPLLVLVGLGTGLMELHESAAAAAFYTLIVEVYIYRDLTWKKVLKVAKDSIALAGAIIVILAMAAALTNYIIHAGIPRSLLEWFVEKGMNQPWQFILVLNVFLFIMGMLMDGFSVLLVGLPLLVPLAANFGLHPFYLAVMFLLNLEIAYISPPVGLNLYISSFRFRRPVVEIYRVVLPFLGMLVAGLLVIIFFPSLSSFTVHNETERLRAEAAKLGVAPQQAWALECIQEDRNNLLPCKAEDFAKWGKDGKGNQTVQTTSDDDEDDFDDDDDDDDDTKPAASPAGSGSPAPAAASPDDDDEDDDD
ncbi:MAG: TRAP transporter large permease subunit [Deltaproteobacteria bacterium]|nr:TRAP transporter large permease subunit [Deltaproteobacteria bacterium]